MWLSQTRDPLAAGTDVVHQPHQAAEYPVARSEVSGAEDALSIMYGMVLQEMENCTNMFDA